jgi:hypothetical protein
VAPLVEKSTLSGEPLFSRKTLPDGKPEKEIEKWAGRWAGRSYLCFEVCPPTLCTPADFSARSPFFFFMLCSYSEGSKQ